VLPEKALRFICSRESSRLADLFGFRTAGALFNFENNPFSFRQALVTIHIDGRKVNEDVAAALFVDEPIPFFVVEPFHCSASQNMTLLFKVRTAWLLWCCVDPIVRVEPVVKPPSQPDIGAVPRFAAGKHTQVLPGANTAPPSDPVDNFDTNSGGDGLKLASLFDLASDTM
jgi:hypothetical protein